MGTLVFPCLHQANNSKLAIEFQIAYLHRTRIVVDVTIPIHQLFHLVDLTDLHLAAVEISNTVKPKLLQSDVLIMDKLFTMRYNVVTWDEYIQIQKDNINAILNDMPFSALPEMYQYALTCEHCYVMPAKELDLETAQVPEPTSSMVNSISGTIIDVDLCLAKNRQLLFFVFASGEPPFQEPVYY